MSDPERAGPQSTDLAEFVQHVEALDKLRQQIRAKRAATRLRTRSKSAFARRLRRVGSYLGHVALEIEEENIAAENIAADQSRDQIPEEEQP